MLKALTRSTRLVCPLSLSSLFWVGAVCLAGSLRVDLEEDDDFTIDTVTSIEILERSLYHIFLSNPYRLDTALNKQPRTRVLTICGLGVIVCFFRVHFLLTYFLHSSIMYHVLG
jgi:hypothetical protein